MAHFVVWQMRGIRYLVENHGDAFSTTLKRLAVH
jgi:hypothetical protein